MMRIVYVLVSAIMATLAGYPLVEAASQIASAHVARLESAIDDN